MICCKCSIKPQKFTMHVFKILPIFLGLLALSKSRPSQLVEGNNREISDADYESSDDSAADEYLHEDESTDEIPQNRNDVPESQEIAQNSKVLSGRYRSRIRDGYEAMSEKSRSERDRRREKISDLNIEDGRYIADGKEHLKSDLEAEEADSERSVSNANLYKRNRQSGDTNIKEKSSASDYVGEPLFKTKQEDINIDRGEYVNEAPETVEQARVIKRYQNSFGLGTRDIRGRKNERHFNNYRDRRQANNEAKDVYGTPSEKVDIDLKNDNSESSIIKNIKKLSERDLEELLNSLPEDKKAILKKIMEKREITKKAGAVEENFLEGGQSDTSKIEGGYVIDSSTDSETSVSSGSDTTEADKHTESGDLENTKNSDSDSGSEKCESKSQLLKTMDQAISRVDTENINNKIKIDANLKLNDESLKTENKREINKIDYVNGDTDSVISEKNDEDVDLKDSNDFSKDHDVLCSDNEEWLDQKEDELKTYSDTHKREISSNNPSVAESSVKSLEESFPNDCNGETVMSPLIRVKRTEKDHSNNKRDTNILSNVKVPFFPGVESEGSENDERSEIEDYGFFDRTSNYARSDENNKVEDKISYKTSDINDRDLKVHQMKNSGKEDITGEAGKTCLGSDTDSVLSGVEGVDDNLMYNSGTRNKRTEEVSAIKISDGAQLSRSGRTAGPINDLVNGVSDNSINVPHYCEEEAFGPISRNYEEESGRFKRIRQTKDTPVSQDDSI